MVRKLLYNFAMSLMTLTAVGSTVTMGILHVTTSNQRSETFHS